MTMRPFLLSDNTKNSYGFVVETEGIQLDRFQKNPILLSMHSRYSGVMGKWDDLKIHEGQLLGVPNFDEEDEDALKLKGKVDRGYINGASIGIFPLAVELKNYEGEETLHVTKSELYEVSIVDVPSNKNAVRLGFNDQSEEEMLALLYKLEANTNTDTDMSFNQESFEKNFFDKFKNLFASSKEQTSNIEELQTKIDENVKLNGELSAKITELQTKLDETQKLLDEEVESKTSLSAELEDWKKKAIEFGAKPGEDPKPPKKEGDDEVDEEEPVELGADFGWAKSMGLEIE